MHILLHECMNSYYSLKLHVSQYLEMGEYVYLIASYSNTM